MAEDRSPSAEWATESVLKRLEERTPAGQTVSAQIFLDESVPAEELSAAAKRIVDAAAHGTGEGSPSAEIGKLHRRARSFSVRAAPAVLRQISGAPEVRTVLPSEIEEGMLIEPVKQTPEP